MTEIDTSREAIARQSKRASSFIDHVKSYPSSTAEKSTMWLVSDLRDTLNALLSRAEAAEAERDRLRVTASKALARMQERGMGSWPEANLLAKALGEQS